MQTPQVKIQPTITLFTAVNHCSAPLQKQKCLDQQGQKVTFMCHDWQILIHFVIFCIFCGQLIVAVTITDNTARCKLVVGVEVQRTNVIERVQ